jgi:hypothetical protein
MRHLLKVFGSLVRPLGLAQNRNEPNDSQRMRLPSSWWIAEPHNCGNAFRSPACGHTRNPTWASHQNCAQDASASRTRSPGAGFTSKNRAKRFVAQGRAEWVEPGVSIRFIPSDPRHASARKSAEATRYWYERAAHTGLAQLSELANLPMVTPHVLLGMGRRKGAGRHTFLATQGV